MLVFVLNNLGKPLMPCKPAKARRLLKDGKVGVVCRFPFTVKFLYGTSGYLQEVKGSIFPSSKSFGIAVGTEKECLYSAETELRQDISKKMKRRSDYRRTRRNRKTRYRKPRFLNRKSDRLLTPTLRSKLESHEREVKKASKMLPIISWVTVRKSTKRDWKGPKDLEWLNLQRQVFERDGFKCRHCKVKSKSFELHAHHKIFRSLGGEDTLDNLVTLCKKCHEDYHAGKFKLKIDGKTSKGRLDTELAIIRKHLKLCENTEEIYGFEVKHRRKELNLKVSNLNNACAILGLKPNHSYNTKNVSKGDYQRTKGIRSQQKIPTGKILGFKKFDKVRYKKVTCFIKGRMSSGYFIGMDGFGNKLKGTLKARDLERISGRSVCLTTGMIHPTIVFDNRGFSHPNYIKPELKKLKQ